MIEEGDYPIIEQMISTALSNFRTDTDGMVRRGTVTTFDADTRVAQVLVDGDTQPVPIESVVPLDLVPGQRVQVTFHAPHGASVTGIAESTLASIYGSILFSFSPFALPNGSLDPLGGLAVFYDSDTIWDGSSEFVVPSGEQGIYSMAVTASSPTFFTPDTRFFTGFTVNGGVYWRDPGGKTGESVCSFATTLALGAGATVRPEVFFSHSSGGDESWDIEVQFLRLARTP